MADTLKQKLNQDLKEALKKKDEMTVSVLRLVFSSIINREIELRKKDIGLSDSEVLETLSSEVKKRRDSIAEFEKGGRFDLAEQEKKELEILKGYLPPEMPDEEIIRIISEGIRETGAKSEKDFGKLMKVVMLILKGKAEGDRVTKIAREMLKSKA
ncbi:MAG: GatB/YqeY domain-containing protein [Candidatus Niyogibacteria bacterium]|nr:GatB/YqeY domain-containing protein [Candidatus Niyogibacteria bacterium]